MKYFKFYIPLRLSDAVTVKPDFSKGYEEISAQLTPQYYELKYFGFDYDAYNEATKEYLITSYTQRPKEVFLSLFENAKRFVAFIDNQVYYIYGIENNAPYFNAIKLFGHAQYNLLVYTMAAVSALSFKKKSIKTDKAFYLSIFSKIAFIGIFIIQIFIESQPRYRYDQYMLMILITFIGSGALIKSKKEKNEESL